MAAGVLFEDHVVLPDGLGFLLGGEGSLLDLDLSGAPSLLGRDGRLSCATLAGGLFPAVRREPIRVGCRRLRSPSLLIRLKPGLITNCRSILYCDRLDARRGVFGARMAVELVNDGPVTLLLEVP